MAQNLRNVDSDPGMDDNSRSPGHKLYRKENTLMVEVESNSKITAQDVIKAVTGLCGEGALLACVPKGADDY